MTSPTALKRPKIVPDAYVLLANWRYLEFSLLRITAAWGRCAATWQDKLAVTRHVWLYAEIVERIRRRLAMFPGGQRDAPVSDVFEHAMNAVLAAPSWPDAMAAVHTLITPSLDTAYRHYIATTHPVHDRPTADVLAAILDSRHEFSAWYADFHTRHPQPIDPAYAARVHAALASIGHATTLIEHHEPHARPVGKALNLTLSATPGRRPEWEAAPNIMPYLQLDWSTSVEARRLFFMVGYMWEMGVAEDQLRWIYSADFMPFEFIHAEARHMWDESRHGDSGRARLADVGIDIADVGYTSYGKFGDGRIAAAMTPRELYEDFYFITQLAETGYFETKRYCFDDFLACRDDASAEMMQFDIIDETSHVEYGRIWLEKVMQHAGVSEDYRKRGAAERARRKAESATRVAALDTYRRTGALPPDFGREAGFLGPYQSLRDENTERHYQHLLRIVREKCPLKNAGELPVRPVLPM